jgi:GT2 family glycosyltransferase
MFLTPDAIKHVEKYTQLFPSTGIFTCFTNRLHPLSKGQLLGTISENADIRHHTQLSERQKDNLYKITPINRPIGGFCMVVNKETWKRSPFREDKKCLGVDNDFSQSVLNNSGTILRMDGIYVWHTYRLMNGYKDKKHLL